jgi:hypothetical protein
VHCQSYLCQKLLFRWEAPQCSQWSQRICLQPTLTYNRLLTSMCGPHGRFAVCASQQWRRVRFQNIDHCIICLPCCWAKCWILQYMDHMEAS